MALIGISMENGEDSKDVKTEGETPVDSASPVQEGAIVGSASRLPVCFLLLAIALPWLFFFWHIRGYWTSASYYNYGWFVPLLGTFLFWRRWRTVPTASPQASGVYWLIAVAAITGFVVLRPLAESMPHWRLLIWFQAGLLLVTTLSLVGGAGGWRWLLHFFWPTAFLMTAIPWPSGFEATLVESLTSTVVDFITVVLLFLGLPAQYLGNVIQVGEETVVVGDVCSGIRSLQALVMVAFFFGELARHDWVRRILLVLAAGALAFGFNCLRALVLTFISLEGDQALFDQWHDIVGGIAFGGSALGLFLLAEWLKAGETDVEPNPALPAASAIRRWFLPAALVLSLVVVAEAGTRAWFGWHESQRYLREEWTIDTHALKEAGFGVEEAEMPPSTLDLLMYNEGHRFVIQTPSGEVVDLYYLVWTGGQQTLTAINGHTPEVCMVAYGGAEILDKEARYGEADVTNDLAVPFTSYEMAFPHQLETLKAFRTVWMVGDPDYLSEEEIKAGIQTRSRMVHLENALGRVSEGKRRFHVKLILAGIASDQPKPEAWREVESVLESLLVPGDR